MGGVKAEFSTFKTIRVPTDLAKPFSRFDVGQIEGPYIVLSGNWVSRHFLLIDWRSEIMVIHSCSVRATLVYYPSYLTIDSEALEDLRLEVDQWVPDHRIR